MDNTILTTIISATIPAIASIIVVFMQTKTNKKITKIEDIKTEILQKIENNKKGYEKEISSHILENDKTYLTDFLSDIEANEPKSELQRRRASEIKDEYNKLGGDSYIDEKWEELVRKGKLKKGGYYEQ